MDNLIGGFDGILPYTKEIERCGTSGQMFRALPYCNQRYLNALKLVKNKLSDSKEDLPDSLLIDPAKEEFTDAPVRKEEITNGASE